jgi:undecaprenyl-diphosphatase
MTIMESILLGILQGVTEFIPVSSSGHLLLLKELFGLREIGLLFDILLHIATLLVTVIVFWQRITTILLSLFNWVFVRSRYSEEDKIQVQLAGLILLATVVTGVIGISIRDLVATFPARGVASLLMITGIILLSTRWISEGTKEYGQITWKDALIMGLAQGFAVLPGISRSGITIVTGLMLKQTRKTAGEFSFIISLPAILAALLLSLDEFGSLTEAAPFQVLALGFLASFVVGLLSLLLLLRFVRSGKLYWFALYLIPVAILGLIFLP